MGPVVESGLEPGVAGLHVADAAEAHVEGALEEVGELVEVRPGAWARRLGGLRLD